MAVRGAQHTPQRSRSLTRTRSPKFTLPEMAAHAALTLFFLLSGQWLAFLLNAPLVAFNVNKCVWHASDLGGVAER